jgi:ABC-type methionine transport system ATPase subunit
MAHLDINISAGSEQVGQPWIWRLCRDFEIRVNIRKANVNGDFGAMLIEVEGPEEELQRATAWLMTTGLRVEAMTRALGA